MYIVEQQAFPLNHLVQCRPADDFATTKALQVEYGVTPCANGLVSDDAGVTMARDYIEFHPEAGIEIVPITAPGNNKGRLFLINPCLTPATQAAAPNENTPAAIGAVIAEKKASIPDQRMGAIAMQVFPNPFSHEIEIRYTLNTLEPTVINLQILDFFGKAIQTIESETERQPGSYSARFNGSALGSGIYMIRLTAGNAEWVTQKIIKIND